VNFSHIIVLSTNSAAQPNYTKRHQETETKRRIFPRKESNYHQVRARYLESCARPANAERAVDFRTARILFRRSFSLSLSHYKAHGIFIVCGCFVSASRSRANIFICISDEILSLARSLAWRASR
jgi:hypothetical protein